MHQQRYDDNYTIMVIRISYKYLHYISHYLTEYMFTIEYNTKNNVFDFYKEIFCNTAQSSKNVTDTISLILRTYFLLSILLTRVHFLSCSLAFEEGDKELNK